MFDRRIHDEDCGGWRSSFGAAIEQAVDGAEWAPGAGDADGAGVSAICIGEYDASEAGAAAFERAGGEWDRGGDLGIRSGGVRDVCRFDSGAVVHRHAGDGGWREGE